MHKLPKGQKNNLSPARYQLLILIQLITLNCWADLSDLKVYSPIVEKGEMGLEILGNTTVDNNNTKDGFQYHELEYEYGVTDWWATSVTASLIKPSQESLKYNNHQQILAQILTLYFLDIIK